MEDAEIAAILKEMGVEDMDHILASEVAGAKMIQVLRNQLASDTEQPPDDTGHLMAQLTAMTSPIGQERDQAQAEVTRLKARVEELERLTEKHNVFRQFYDKFAAMDVGERSFATANEKLKATVATLKHDADLLRQSISELMRKARPVEERVVDTVDHAAEQFKLSERVKYLEQEVQNKERAIAELMQNSRGANA